MDKAPKAPKLKICKCSHLRENHYKDPSKKFKFLGDCQLCQCSHYLRRDRPNTIDKISSAMFFGIAAFLVIIFSVFAISMYELLEMAGEEPHNTPPDISLYEFTELLILAIGALILWFCLWFFNTGYEYFDMKKRRDHNVYPEKEFFKKDDN